MNAPILVAPKSEAEDLAERTAKAVQYGCRHMASDLAEFIDSLELPKEEAKKAMTIADATETYIRVISWMAAYTYGLCLMLRKDTQEAGKYFRLEAVQLEMRARAMRAARSVFER